MPPIRVIYEDKDIIALNKPAGVLVHQTRGERLEVRGEGEEVREETLVDWVVERYPEVSGIGDDPAIRPGITHRLDRDTSGVIVVARNQRSFDFLKALFQSHKIEKTYLALVYGRVKEARGVIDAPIGLKSGTVRHTTHLAKNVKLAKDAITAYEAVGRYHLRDSEFTPTPESPFCKGEHEWRDIAKREGKSHACKPVVWGFTLLKVRPETGRTHQIRVHLASIGHPVVGDNLYGNAKCKIQNAKLLKLSRQFLHAESVSFTSPSGERLTISADLPEDLEQALGQLSPELAAPQPRN